MRQEIQQAVVSARSLPEIYDGLMGVLEELRVGGVIEIGYVAGMVSSEGPERITTNLEILRGYVDLMYARFPGEVFFSAGDVFNHGVYARLPESTFPERERKEVFKAFWRRVFGSGGVNSVSFTPRWRRSEGSVDEHDTVIILKLPHRFIMQPRPRVLLVRSCCDSDR